MSPGEETVEALLGLVRGPHSPWALVKDSSAEDRFLRELAIQNPLMLKDTFFYSYFRSLRVVDKQVGVGNEHWIIGRAPGRAAPKVSPDFSLSSPARTANRAGVQPRCVESLPPSPLERVHVHLLQPVPSMPCTWPSWVLVKTFQRTHIALVWFGTGN